MRNLISKKKPVYPVGEFFAEYLARYGRVRDEGVRYEDLARYSTAVPLYDEEGADTLWSSVFYAPSEQQELYDHLRFCYALLKADGDFSVAEHLFIERVDLCHYGNTLPFRVRIVNRLNDNFDYFYVKRVDANRVYGLELEHILSPNHINYFTTGETLIEEHIIGIPGDVFMREAMPGGRFDQVRLAKEFVKFNERCFVRLLGDMHSGNFVVDITRDFEKWHYRMRAIDFDQQSHHWRQQVYLPQYFVQNNPLIQVGMSRLAPENVVQYQKEERALIAGRLRALHSRYERLMTVMREDLIAPEDHVERLREQLAEHYGDVSFREAYTMGELVHASLQHLMEHNRPATVPFLPDTGAMPWI